MDIDEVMLETEDAMDNTIAHMAQEFASVRTGKASPALVENIIVEVYGTHMKIRELANVTTPEPRLLVIQPFDNSTNQAIEKAIKESRIGINPISDGRLLRLPVPELTAERREQLAKQARVIAEEAKVGIRGHRRTALDTFKKAQKDSTITEDDLRRLEKDVQELHDKFIAKVDSSLEEKVKDISHI
jgi:ribosome recycling factor